MVILCFIGDHKILNAQDELRFVNFNPDIVLISKKDIADSVLLLDLFDTQDSWIKYQKSIFQKTFVIQFILVFNFFWVETKQWPLAGEFVEFEYSPKIRQFGKFEYSPKWPFPPFWPDSIHSPANRQLLSPDSIHSTDIRQPLSPDSIHSRKANLHKFSKFSEFSEFGKFSECRLDRFIHIKYVICA